MALLTAENLSLGYESRPVVADLNFTVNKGDYLCVVGENGSGTGIDRIEEPFLQTGVFYHSQARKYIIFLLDIDIFSDVW